MSSYDIVEDDDAMCPSSSRLFSASPFSLLLASSLNQTLRVHDDHDEDEDDEDDDGRHLPKAKKVVKTPKALLFENATSLTLR